MRANSAIFDALYTSPKPLLAQVQKPELVAVAPESKEELTPNQQRVVQNCIEQMRGIRGTLSIINDGRSFAPSLNAALKAADVYAGCAIAELRSTFLNYEKPL